MVSLNESGNKVRLGLVLRTGAHQGRLGTRLALGLYSTLVLIRRGWERGKPRDCTLYWCSPGETGNEASHELALGTGAHQESLGTRLAMSLHSILVFIRGATEQG